MEFRNSIHRTWNDNHLYSVMFELTYACNLDCSFCYNDLDAQGTPLTLEQYFHALEDLAAMNVMELTLTGGEPLAHPQFFQIGAKAKELGFVVRIKSNGHALREDMVQRIQKEIDPFMIEVSLHGATADTHDRQTRVPGSFARLIANIKTMTRLGMRLRVNSTMTRWNVDELEEMHTLCDSLGVTLRMDPDVKPRDNGDQDPLDLLVNEAGLKKLEALRQKRSQAMSALDEQTPQQIEPTKNVSSDKHCGAGSNGLCIDPFGNVLPCVQWRHSVGSLHDRRIAEIWNFSDELIAVRETTKRVKQVVSSALSPQKAASFCPGAAILHGGSPFYLYQEAEVPKTKRKIHLPLVA